MKLIRNYNLDRLSCVNAVVATGTSCGWRPMELLLIYASMGRVES